MVTREMCAKLIELFGPCTAVYECTDVEDLFSSAERWMIRTPIEVANHLIERENLFYSRSLDTHFGDSSIEKEKEAFKALFAGIRYRLELFFGADSSNLKFPNSWPKGEAPPEAPRGWTHKPMDESKGGIFEAETPSLLNEALSTELKLDPDSTYIYWLKYGDCTAVKAVTFLTPNGDLIISWYDKNWNVFTWSSTIKNWN